MRLKQNQSDITEEFSTTSVFVTPMLDMSFQLLAFFIFTYHPSALEGQFPITLAVGESGGPQQPSDPLRPANPREQTEVRPAVTVIAKAGDRGNLSSLEIAVAGRKEIIKGQEGQDASLESLLAEFETKLYEYRQDDSRILLQASPTLRWEESMRIMDSCRQTSLLWDLLRDGRRPEAQKRYPAALYNQYKDSPILQALKRKNEPVKLFPRIEMELIRGGSSASS